MSNLEFSTWVLYIVRMFLLHYSRTGRCWSFPCTRWSYKTWKTVRRKLESFDVTSLPNFKSLCLSRLDITPEGKCLCPQLPETLGAVVEVDFFCWMCLAGNLYGPKIETIQGLKDPHEYSSRIYPLCWQYLTQDIWEVHRLYEVSPFTWQLPFGWLLILVFSIFEYFHFNGCRISHISSTLKTANSSPDFHWKWLWFSLFQPWQNHLKPSLVWVMWDRFLSNPELPEYWHAAWHSLWCLFNFC